MKIENKLIRWNEIIPLITIKVMAWLKKRGQKSTIANRGKTCKNAGWNGRLERENIYKELLQSNVDNNFT